MAYLRLPRKAARSLPIELLTTDGCELRVAPSICGAGLSGIVWTSAAPAALAPNGDAGGAAMAAPGTDGRLGTACCNVDGCGCTSIGGAASGAACGAADGADIGAALGAVAGAS